MPTTSIEQAVQIAVQHQRAGRLAEAEKVYRQILAEVPDHAEVLNSLGVLAGQSRRKEMALGMFTRAVAIRPTWAWVHGNLGNALREMGRLEEAIAACSRAIQLKPDLAEAHNNLGTALKEIGRLDEAIAAYNRAIHLKANYAEAHDNLGNTLTEKGRFDEAIAACGRAIQLKPDFAQAHYNLGVTLSAMSRLDEAISAYNRAIQLKPDYGDAYYNLGNLLQGRGRLDEAIAAQGRAITLKPDYAEAHNNLGVTLSELGRLDEAISAYGRAIRLKPDFAQAYCNLGGALMDVGRVDEAIAGYRRAVDLKPDFTQAQSNLVYSLYFSEDDPAAIMAEHRGWVDRHAAPLAGKMRPHDNDRDPHRRLRIGYVSPDFRQHVVGLNLLPAFRQHDHRQFEIFCYSNVVKADSLTGEFRACADQWRDLSRVSDERAAQMIRDDKIDILIDLTLHMAGHRLLVFARKPAPVQVTYLGYCGTTGMKTMDYRLSDPWLDEAEGDLSYYSERTLRLSRSYWCYQPGSATPDVEPRDPARPVTFGCLNNFAKVSAATLDLWGRILKSAADWRLILYTPAGQARRNVADRLAAAGVAAERIEFVPKQSWEAYIRTYQRMDVALDPFPYGGGITSCDSLWMGVPVVSLAGKTAVGRGGRSILNNIGLPELVADTPEQYLRIATELAGDLSRLANLRRGLRDRMKDSPLMDAAGFTRDLESAYRRIWIDYCLRQ